MIEILTEENWKEKIEKSCQLTLVDFERTMADPHFMESLCAFGFLEKWGCAVQAGVLNAGRFADLSHQFSIFEFPTLVLFAAEKPLIRFSGPNRVAEMMGIFNVKGLAQLGIVFASMVNNLSD